MLSYCVLSNYSIFLPVVYNDIINIILQNKPSFSLLCLKWGCRPTFWGYNPCTLSRSPVSAIHLRSAIRLFYLLFSSELQWLDLNVGTGLVVPLMTTRVTCPLMFTVSVSPAVFHFRLSRRNIGTLPHDSTLCACALYTEECASITYFTFTCGESFWSYKVTDIMIHV